MVHRGRHSLLPELSHKPTIQTHIIIHNIVRALLTSNSNFLVRQIRISISILNSNMLSNSSHEVGKLSKRRDNSGYLSFIAFRDLHSVIVGSSSPLSPFFTQTSNFVHTPAIHMDSRLCSQSADSMCSCRLLSSV